MSSTDLPIRAAMETAMAHGIAPDRCEILQNGSTLVLRLTESLVARVVTDIDGPRQGTEWFARENAIACHLAAHGAPVIPLHPDIPPGPYGHLGYPLNFWKFVTVTSARPSPEETGRTLFHCHRVLATFPGELPALSIPAESLGMLPRLEEQRLLPTDVLELLGDRLASSLRALAEFPRQPLHGDAHPGNLLATTCGFLWTDWEDTFSGPCEWDLASIIWNARILDGDHDTADRIVAAYQQAGGAVNPRALHFCMIARAAVMTVWYPILYPAPSPERSDRLQRRIAWLQENG